MRPGMGGPSTEPSELIWDFDEESEGIEEELRNEGIIDESSHSSKIG